MSNEINKPCVITDDELKYVDKLTRVEKEYINELRFNCCIPCWIKHLRPIFLNYVVFASKYACSTDEYVFSRSIMHFRKCTHKTPTFIPHI